MPSGAETRGAWGTRGHLRLWRFMVYKLMPHIDEILYALWVSSWLVGTMSRRPGTGHLWRLW